MIQSVVAPVVVLATPRWIGEPDGLTRTTVSDTTLASLLIRTGFSRPPQSGQSSCSCSHKHPLGHRYAVIKRGVLTFNRPP